MAKKIIRLSEVTTLTGLSQSSIYKQIRLGLFPKCVKLTSRATGWDSEAVQAWIDEKLAQSEDIS